MNGEGLPRATWKVELVPEAWTDFNKLDGSVKKRVLKQLVKLERDPKYGDSLGNKAGINLEGYSKLNAVFLLNFTRELTQKNNKS